MTFIALLAGLGVFCALLWYCAIYALPVFVGFWAAWWALNHGAGLACVAVGLIAGVATWLVGRLTAARNNRFLRLLGLAVFVTPAACAGFSIAHDLASSATPVLRGLLAALGAIAVGSVTYVRLIRYAA